MRTHRSHEILAPWTTGAAVLDAERLAAVRIEPVLRRRRPALALDLYLAAERGDTVIPLAIADPAAVVERDRDPIVWPADTLVDDAVAAALWARIAPHLERLVLSGERVREHVVRFADAPRFESARAAGCFGAAPLRDALVRLAPYRYARRFVRGRSVLIDADDAIGGWALLRGVAATGVAASRRDAAAIAWYGDPAEAPRRADVAIVGADADAGEATCALRLDAEAPWRVDVVDPLPLDVGIVFDPAEGPVRRWFAVERAPEPATRATHATRAATGGSAGRIAVALGRADAARLPSADTDEAAALVVALRAEGFDAFAASVPGELNGADLVHLIGTRHGARARAFVEAAHRAGAAVVVQPCEEAAESGGWWGATAARHCFEHASDERELESYLALLARRVVSVGAATADGSYAPALAAPDDAAAALRDADLVFAASEEEAETIRGRRGRVGPIEIAPPLAPDAVASARIGALVGSDPFALVHAPIGPLANQLLVARAARDASIPLVLAGPVADAAYLELVREFGGASLVVLGGEPACEVASALRGAAGVVADCAWLGDGGARLAAASLAGARLVVAERRAFAPARAQRCDPADVRSIARALGAAWDEALRVRERAADAAPAPGTAIRAIVRGYARAAGTPA
ncbi:MAG TPA: hypothetical protein VFB22_11860 [Candidatus Baltobacteraceae bacterium]|nr:hypothetical protein [Candidatus Baltobacteraceae bacterium]